MKVTRKEIVAKVCYEVCKRVLPKYSSKRGPKKYEFWQLVAMYLYGIIYDLTYRDLEEEFLVSDVLRRALNLKEVPHYSTICKAVKRLSEEDLKKLLEESAKLLDVKLDVLAIDSTGLREDNASCYYAKRSGKKRKSWTKMTIVVDVESQVILSEDVRMGPGNDGVILREMFERGDIPFCEVLLADSGYDCKGNEKIAIFKPIRRGGCYKSLERIHLFLRWLFTSTIGLYGKRWIVETVISVIKRRFGDRIKSRSPDSKFVETHLIPVAYNIWRFFIASYLVSILSLLTLPNSITFNRAIQITLLNNSRKRRAVSFSGTRCLLRV
ncbi:transposase [Archaeoglobus sp.]